MPLIKVFVSSTWTDLQAERQAVAEILQRFRQTRFVGMEYFGTSPDDTRTASLQQVDRSDVYIGIVGQRYGSGITEAEYHRARDRELPCLIYLKDPAASGEAAPDSPEALDRWKQELLTHHAVTVFQTPSELAARLAADLHNWLFDKYIVGGIAAVSAPSAERIQHFLAEYTGTAGQPVPFGGRDDRFAALTTWVDDLAGPTHLVLAAPAGRGKSALLVRWSRTLGHRDDLAIVFFPISIRFNTNLGNIVFVALAARLAELHEEPLQVPPNASVELWRGLVASYLGRPLPGGRRLLLILDGVDEAADWEAGPDLFPHVVASGTKIVVSARYLADADATSWLRRLGLDAPGRAVAMSLDPLTPSGVADVLASSGLAIAPLSTRVDLVAEMHRLSEGDPLLVRLYVASLSADAGSAARLNPEDLPHIEPGLTGFFNRWWDDQRRLWGAQTPLREPGVQALLNSLACALGPLKQQDLLQLSAPDAHLNAWTLEDALRPISRFVVGDGVAQGYAFSHPRLGSYFYDRLRRAGQAGQHESRFVSWGQQTLAALRRHEIEPAAVPTYLIQYFRPHLERAAGGVESLRGLVTLEWLQAWSVLDKGSFTGFLSDVRRVWHAAAQADAAAIEGGEPAPYVDLELRCALCVSSVFSMAEEIPAAVLVALVRSEIWTPAQAIGYASNIPDTRVRVDTLLQLSDAVPTAHRDQLLGAALSSARSDEDAVERDALLCLIALRLREPLAALRHVADRTLRLDRIRELMGTGAHSWRQTDALIDAATIARGLDDPYRRIELLEAMAAHLPEPDREQALAAAAAAVMDLIARREPAERIVGCLAHVPDEVVPRLVSHAAESTDAAAAVRALACLAGRCEDGSAVLAAAIDVVRGAREDERGTLLAALIAGLPAPLVWPASAAAAAIADPEQRIMSLRAAATWVPTEHASGVFGAILEAIEQVQTPARQAQLLVEMAPTLPTELVPRALAITRTLALPLLRIASLRAIAAAHEEHRRDSLAAALTAWPDLPAAERVHELRRLLPSLTDVVSDESMFEAIRWCSKVDQVELFREASLRLPGERRTAALAQAIDVLDQLEDADRQPLLWTLVPDLDPPLARRAVSLARRLKSRRQRLEALRAVGARLDEPARQELLLESLAQAERWPDPRARARLLCDLGSASADPVRERAFRAAVDGVGGIEDDEQRGRGLLEIARIAPTSELSRIVAIASAIASVEPRVRTLAEIAQYLDAPHRLDALDLAARSALAIGSPELRVCALRRIAQVMPEERRRPILDSALDAMQSLGADRRTAELKLMLAVMPVDLADSALRVARSQPHPERRVRELLAVAGVLPGDARAVVVADALSTVSLIDDEAGRVDALGAILGALPPALFDRSLETVQAVASDDARAQLFASLAANAEGLSPAHAGLLFEAIARLPTGDTSNDALLALLRRSAVAPFDAVIDRVRAVGNPFERGQLLVALGQKASDERRTAAMVEAFGCVAPEPDFPDRTMLLVEIAPDLPPPLVPDLLALALRAVAPRERARLLRAAVDRLSNDERSVVLKREFAALQQRPTAGVLVDWMAMFGDVLPKALFDEGLLMITEAHDMTTAARALRAVADACLDPLRRSDALASAILAARQISSLDDRLEVLLELGPDATRRTAEDELTKELSAATPDAARDVARRILELPDPSPELVQSVLQVMLARDPHGPATLRMAELLDVTLLPTALISALSGEHNPVPTTLLLERLQSARIPWTAVFDVLRGTDEASQGRVLHRLLPHLPDDALQTAFDLAATLSSPQMRHTVFCALADRTSGPVRERSLIEAWRAIRLMRDPASHCNQLRKRTIAGDAPPSETIWSEALTTVMAIADKDARRSALADLAPHLSTPLLLQTLTILQIIRDDVERANALAAMLPHLGDGSERQAVADRVVEVARAMTWPRQRAATLAQVAVSLEPPGREVLLREALAALRQAPDSERASAMRDLAPALATASDDCLAEALALAPESSVADLLPWLPTPLLPKAFAEGGNRAAAPLERLRLLSYSMEVLHLTADEALAAVASRDETALRETVLLLRDGRLAISHEFVRHHTSSPEAAVLCSELCAGPAGEAMLELALGRVIRLRGTLLADAFVEVVPHLSPALQDRALLSLPAIADDGGRASILRRVAPRLPPSALRACLVVLASIGDREDREATAARLALLSPDPVPDRTLAFVRSLGDPAERVACAGAVSVRLTGAPQRALVTDALASLGALPTGTDRAQVFCAVAGAVPDELLPQVLAAVAAIDHDGCAAEAVAAIVPRLAPRHFAAVLDLTARLADPARRVLVLRAVVRHAPEQVLTAALSSSALPPNAFHRAQVLEVCAPRLTPACLPEVLAAAATITSAAARVDVLVTLAAHSPVALPDSVLAAACRDVRQVADEPYRAHLLDRMTSYLPDAVMDDCLHAIEEIQEDFVRADALRAFAGRAPARLWARTMAAAAGIEDGHHRASLFATLGSRLAPGDRGPVLERALDTANTIHGAYARAEALRAMAVHMNEGDAAICAAAWSAALSVHRTLYTVKAIAELAPVLPPQVLGDVFEHAVAIPTEHDRVGALEALAPFLPQAMLERALAATMVLRSDLARRDLCTALVPHLDDALWPMALDATVAMKTESYRADTLITAARHAPQTLFGRVLAAADALRDDSCRLKALSGVLPLAPDEFCAAALDTCDRFAHDGYRFALLAAVAHQLPAAWLPAAAGKAARLSDPDLRARALALCGPRQPDRPESPPEPISRDVRRSRGPISSDRAVPAHADVRTSRKHALTRIARLELDRDKVDTLKGVLRDVRAEDTPEIMTIVRALGREEHRIEALTALIPIAPDEAIPDIWNVLRDVKSDPLRLPPLERLANRIATADRAPTQTLWSDVLRFLSQRHRGRLLDGVRVLVPSMQALGTASVMRDVAAAIDDVCRWWAPGETPPG